MSCDEEFGLFLIANQNYVPYGSEPINGARDNRTFFCSDRQERQYYVPFEVRDCNVEYAQFLSDNPQFRNVTDFSNPRYEVLFDRYMCSSDNVQRYYGYTPEANLLRAIEIAEADPTVKAYSDEGRLFIESEKPPGVTMEDWYVSLSDGIFSIGRLYAYDGSFVVLVGSNTRYAIRYPQYIVTR